MRKRATLAVLMPSMFGLQLNDVLFRYLREGNYLEVKEKWPSYIVNRLFMHRSFLADDAEHPMSRMHPKITGSEEVIAGMGILCTEDYSCSRILLKIEIELVGNQENNRYLDEEKEPALIIIVKLLCLKSKYAGYFEKRRFKTV